MWFAVASVRAGFRRSGVSVERRKLESKILDGGSLPSSRYARMVDEFGKPFPKVGAAGRALAQRRRKSRADGFDLSRLGNGERSLVKPKAREGRASRSE